MRYSKITQEAGKAYISQLELLATVQKGVAQYQDKQVKPGSRYGYTARVFYPDGQLSPFGSIVNLSF